MSGSSLVAELLARISNPTDPFAQVQSLLRSWSYKQTDALAAELQELRRKAALWDQHVSWEGLRPASSPRTSIDDAKPQEWDAAGKRERVVSGIKNPYELLHELDARLKVVEEAVAILKESHPRQFQKEARGEDD